MDEIVPNKCVHIIEDDGTNKSTRVCKFTVRKNMVASVAQVGNSQTNNRTLIQPPEPYETDNRINSEDFSYETNELISVRKDTKKWTSNLKNLKHPFLNYLDIIIIEKKAGLGNFYRTTTNKMFLTKI